MMSLSRYKPVALVMPQEIEKAFGLATGRAQMDIRYPDGTVAVYPYSRIFVQIQSLIPVNRIDACNYDRMTG
jgi:hypothetical protein